MRIFRSALAASLLALATSAMAQDAFNLEETVQLCTSCHGETGVPVDETYPIIFGQQFFYIYTQLKDYSAGRRQNEIMTGIAAEYSRDQMKEIAQYFADQAWPDVPAHTQDGDQALAERGITGGQCSACHGKWEGDSRIPRLAGQQVGYLDKAMLDFKNEVRMNAPDKISTMKQLDDATIAALARYLGAM
ncbi:c-type cytochrome [Primorskyibacter sp. 2E233]|uniref:c-type cytochrome n=1 Tax=Primorskyibacter sp. 2E233 TaxID=3413431 RepID=UPI003BF38023